MECANCGRDSNWQDITVIEYTNDNGDFIEETHGVCELCETFHIITKNRAENKTHIQAFVIPS